MKKIPLTKGLYALVDDGDYKELSKYNWFASGHPGQLYACRYNPKNKSRHIRMHRQILNAPENMEVDHINLNRLDNRRSNLRLATRQENSFNRKKFNKKSHSKYKGVTFHIRDRCWQACIRVNGKHIYLGSFDKEVDSAMAYNKAAKKYHGKFANINIIQEENYAK